MRQPSVVKSESIVIMTESPSDIVDQFTVAVSADQETAGSVPVMWEVSLVPVLLCQFIIVKNVLLWSIVLPLVSEIANDTGCGLQDEN